MQGQSILTAGFLPQLPILGSRAVQVRYCTAVGCETDSTSEDLFDSQAVPGMYLPFRLSVHVQTPQTAVDAAVARDFRVSHWRRASGRQCVCREFAAPLAAWFRSAHHDVHNPKKKLKS